MIIPQSEVLMRRTKDPGFLEGSDLMQWYRRTVGQVEAERKAGRADAHSAFFARQGDPLFSTAVETENPDSTRPGPGEGWREARLTVPPAPPVQAPDGVRIGVPPPEGSVPVVAPPGGFFRTYSPAENPTFGPAYFTDLPSPLNRVTPKVGGWFELGDGSLVRGVDEVERLHAEQQRLMLGEDEPQPSRHMHTADRFRDGVIPQAGQIGKGQREKDSTCHPFGGWEQDPGFPKNTERTRRYESQISRAPGLDYVVRNPGEKPVKFDGCAVWDPRRQLLEAKGLGYQSLFRRAERSSSIKTPEKTRRQVIRQSAAARSRTVEWLIAEPDAVPYFSAIAAPYPSLRMLHTPAR